MATAKTPDEPQPEQTGSGANDIAFVAHATEAAVNPPKDETAPVTFINAAGVRVDPNGEPVEDAE